MRVANQLRRSLFSVALLANLSVLGTVNGVPTVDSTAELAAAAGPTCVVASVSDEPSNAPEPRSDDTQRIDWRAMLPSVTLSTGYTR